MSRNPPAFAVLALVALTVAGCRRETPDETVATAPPPAAEVAPATAPAPASPDVVTVVENTAADAITNDSKGFDAKAFAGSFDGVDATLTLNADGNFILAGRRQQAGTTIDGTWTAEQDGKRIRLDPNSKSEPDRVYGIASNDLLTPLSSDGRPTADGTDHGLRRSR